MEKLCLPRNQPLVPKKVGDHWALRYCYSTGCNCVATFWLLQGLEGKGRELPSTEGPNLCQPLQKRGKFSSILWVAQMVKNLPAKQETQVRSLRCEDPQEKAMATHSSILAWRIPRTEEPGRLQPVGLQRVGHDWVTKHTHTHILWSQHCYCNSHCTDENQILRLSILHEASEKQCWHLNLNLFLPALCSRHYRRHLLPQSQIHPLTGGGNQQPQVNALILANCFTNECCLDDQEEHRGEKRAVKVEHSSPHQKETSYNTENSN